jgi:CBS domain-containing protein
MRVEEVMTKDVAVCTPNTVIKDCANLMVKEDCGEIPIVESNENKKLVGVITDRDITCRVVAKGIDPSNAKVEDYMTEKVFTVKKEDDLERSSQLMSEKQVRRLPVVDDNMNCIGIVSQAHIARHFSEEKAGELAKDLSEPHEQNQGEEPTQNLRNQ